MKASRIVLVLVLLAALAFWLLPRGGGPTIEEGSILALDLEGDFVEAADPPLLSRLMGDRRRAFVSVLSELRKAERDERIAAVVIRVRDLQIGWAQAQEIRDAIRSVRGAGKKTLAYLELASFGANLEYYVATSADEVHAAPGTRAPVVGLAAEYLFLGGLFESVGVELEVERIGRYKTAADTLAGTEMSDAHREMAEALLDSIDEQFVGGIAEGRGLSPDFVRTAIDSAPADPEEMVSLGLIDAVSFFDQVVEAAGGGPLLEGKDYAGVGLEELGIVPAAQFALVYGSGNVVVGRGQVSPGGSPVLASDTVSEALEDAAEDDSIDAIIFRIDSPGGSALASDVVWRATQLARAEGKPLIASFSDVAASGGYYVAAGADAVVASEGSITGSIGVFALRPVIRDLLDRLDVGVEGLTRGAHADLLLASRPLSEPTRERLRSQIDSVYQQFLGRVSTGRGLETAEVDAVGRGRVWTGAQAAEIGLVDELGGLRTAVDQGKEALDLDPDADVVLIPYPKPRSLVQQLDDALRRVALEAAPRLPLPRPLEGLLALLETTPTGAPALVPSFWIDIR